MLSVLAKLKSTSIASVNSANSAMDIFESDVNNVDQPIDSRQQLLELSKAIDQETAKLEALLSGQPSSSEDCTAIDDVLNCFKQELDQLESKISLVDRALQDHQSQGDVLLDRIHQWIRQQVMPTTSPGLELRTPPTATPTMSSRGSLRSVNGKFSTPLRHRAMLQNATPRQPARRDSMIDFDAFPRTPTLEDIGISQTTLAAVGAPKKKESTLSIGTGIWGQRGLRSSLSSLSEAISTPKLSYLNSSGSGSNLGSGAPNLATHLTESSSVDMAVEADEQILAPMMVISSTPTVVNGRETISPFGGNSKFNIPSFPSINFIVFGGRPSSGSLYESDL